MSGRPDRPTYSGDVAGQSETIRWQSRMTRPRPRPVTGRFPGQLRRRNCTDSGAVADCRATRRSLPRAASRSCRRQPFITGFECSTAASEAHVASRPAHSSVHLEIATSRGDTPHALGVCRLVVTGFWRVVWSLDGMGSSDRNIHRARRPERERQRRQPPKWTSPDAGSDPAGDMHAPERRTAATACGWCGGTITPGRRGPIPKWCSATCRHRAWEQTRAAASGLSAVKLVERRVEVQVPLVPTRRDWPRLLGEFVGQLDDGRVYDRNLPALARALPPVLESYRGRAHLTGAPHVH